MTNSSASLDESGAYRAVRRPAGFRRLLESIMEVGREVLALRRDGARKGEPADTLGELCQQLLDHRGEASGLALANEILDGYQSLSPPQRLAFYAVLSEQFGPDPQAVTDAAAAYRIQPGFETLSALSKAIEAPRQKLFRRLNMAPDGTRRLVRMRGHLLDVLGDRPELRAVESDLRHLLIAWFNRGFLVMDRIDWTASANVLERIIAYEAVHEINGWDDLRTRLAQDRRCFAFFHPAMPDDPLIFVQVALTNGMATAIGPLIAAEREIENAREADTAVFYSITNCHQGLRGISFGHFLIKQVVEELRRDLEGIKQFVTLSPVTGLCHWILNAPLESLPNGLGEEAVAAREILHGIEPPDVTLMSETERTMVLRVCARYLLEARDAGEPVDPVARFHLGNGAALERINWAADTSTAGLSRSAGIMVNYVYRLKDIERNHERYFAEGEVVASSAVKKLAKAR